jgi:hypothetical protein
LKKDEGTEKEKMHRDKKKFLFILDKSGDTECKVLNIRGRVYTRIRTFSQRKKIIQMHKDNGMGKKHRYKKKNTKVTKGKRKHNIRKARKNIRNEK